MSHLALPPKGHLTLQIYSPKAIQAKLDIWSKVTEDQMFRVSTVKVKVDNDIYYFWPF